MCVCVCVWYLLCALLLFGQTTINPLVIWPVSPCLPMIQNLTSCPPEITSVSLLLSIFVKNKGKYVFFSHFMSLSSQNKTMHKTIRETRSKNIFFLIVKIWLKNTLPLYMNILEPINPNKYKFKKSSQTTLIYMINLKFKKSYTFRHTQVAAHRETDRGKEREKEREDSRSKTSSANPLPTSKTTITETMMDPPPVSKDTQWSPCISQSSNPQQLP